MRIKRLEIKGFKSFPDKTVLELKGGITAVVGPNGCGKSNIFEAIRWVMGEQRARVLRGKKMEDVIFNGSDSRKPVGLGEVRLVLSNEGGPFTGAMADYDEVMITRRLFRDGESQYEINGVPCRLTDITDFFLDTGVGRNSYAVIEQGRVDMVVASRPEDRRVLIEEAAGINRYKARREAAIKKLEQTKQNLLRISDVIAEVKRQSASLKRQASQADRYRKLSEQHRLLDIAYHAHRCESYSNELSAIRTDLHRHQGLFHEKNARFSAMQAGLEKVRLDALDAERSLSELIETHHKTDLELAAVRAAAERDRGGLERLVEVREQDAIERASLEEQLNRGRAARSALNERAAAITSELDAVHEELHAIGPRKGALERTVAEQRGLWENLKDAVFNTLQKTATERNAREELTRRHAEISSRLKRITAEAEEVSALMASERERREELVLSIANIENKTAQENANRSQLMEESAGLQRSIDSLRDSITACEREVAAAKARRESLAELQQSYSAYDEGVRYLMQDPGSAEENGLLGPLGELVHVPPEYQKAVIAALGDRLGHMVVGSPREGAAAANLLKAAEAGRTTFIPLSPRLDGHRSPGPMNGLVQLTDVVEWPDELKDLGDFLLGRSFVVEDIARALEIWEKNGVSVDLVTRAGDLVNRYGEITGGSGNRAGEDIFERKREIARLSGDVSRLEAGLVQVQSDLNNQNARILQCTEAIRNADAALSNLRITEAGLRKDLETIDRGLMDLERRLSVLTLENDRLSKEISDQSSEIGRTEENIARLEILQKELEKQREDARVAVDASSIALEAEVQRHAGARVRAAQIEERKQSLDRECRAAASALEQMTGRMTALAERVQRKAEEEQRLIKSIEEGELEERRLMAVHATQQRTIETSRHNSAELAENAKRLDAAVAADGKAVAELRTTIHGLEMEIVRVEQVLDGLVEKIVERYHVDPRAVTVPDKAPIEEEITGLKTRLDAMGEVNLAAIAESRQMEERLSFLTEQESDLRAAVDSLYATINRINKTTRDRFRVAFEQINEKFQEIFPFLFRGGEARLVLTDEDDLLETGVDIMARPPGKRVRNMDLLSGGEKALTAVALIFSIFLTRPSPFCLLDEVDAPLDDSNIIRFNEMLAKLADQTQFLVITHNKRSMETADTLYGVTMEEAGASTVVSVTFA